MYLAVLLADYAGTVDVSNRIELRGRETQVPPAAPGAVPGSAAAPTTIVGVDVADVPSAHLELRGHVWDTTLDYSAFAIIPDLETGRPVPQVLQTGAVGEVWHDRTVRLGVLEYAQYGEQNSGYLYTAPTNPTATAPGGAPAPTTGATPVQALANPISLLYGSSRTDLTSQITVSRRWLETSLLEYALQGGVDAASRATLPLVYGPRAEVTLQWVATRLDAIETKVTGAHTDASAGPCVAALLTPLPPGATCAPTGDILQWNETWRHRLSRHTDAWIGAGPAFVVERPSPAAPYEDALYPVVLAGFQYQSSIEQVRSLLRLDAALAPIVDIRSGIVDDRAQGALTLQVPIRKVTMIGGLSATRSVDSLLSQPVESVQGSFEVELKVDPELSLGAGARYGWVNQQGVGAFSSGFALLQATFHAKRLRF